MLRADSKRRYAWDTCIILIAIWIVFFVPLEVAFGLSATHMGYTIVSLIFDLIFVFDIALNFRTTYFTREGD